MAVQSRKHERSVDLGFLMMRDVVASCANEKYATQDPQRHVLRLRILSHCRQSPLAPGCRHDMTARAGNPSWTTKHSTYIRTGSNGCRIGLDIDDDDPGASLAAHYNMFTVI